MGIILTYDQPGIRRKVQLQLTTMHAANLKTLRLMI